MSKTITRTGLKQLFTDLGRRAVFATIIAQTNCRPAKGVKQRLIKRATINGLFGPRDNEKTRAWGNRVDGTGLVEHNGNDYVELLVQSVGHESYHDADSLYIVEGGKALTRQRDLAGDNLRDYRLDNILEVRVNKEVYLVENG